MIIHFIGLSCFLIENEAGFRIVVDPFSDAPEWSVGLRFPKEFQGKPFGANIVLSSEPDADHSFAPGDWLYLGPKTSVGSDPFPDLGLKGTVVYEYGGDVNIAYHYTVDGLRLLHLGDNAHELTLQQLREIGQVDIVFMPGPKVLPETNDGFASRNIIERNIAHLSPKVIVWAHHLVPVGTPINGSAEELRAFFRSFFRSHARTSKLYKNEDSFIELCYVFENALMLNGKYRRERPETSSVILTASEVQSLKQPRSILFTHMLASSTLE